MERDNLQEVLLALLKDAAGPQEQGWTAGDDAAAAGGSGTFDAVGSSAPPLRTAAVAGETRSSEANGTPAAAETAEGTLFLQRLVEITEAETAKIENSTRSLIESTLGQAAGLVVKDALGGGVRGLTAVVSPLVSLVTGLAKLIGGGGESEPAPLVKYSLPEALSLEAGLVSPQGSIDLVDRDLVGRPRAVGNGGATQVTVNVQAMDSQSFLDHSEDIARAVREAILNSHPLNEVLNEI